MKISRTQPLNHIEIKRPRWKERVVGIATYRVKEQNSIDIVATSPKDGARYYPNTFYATKEDIVKNEKQTLPSGVVLYLVPIDTLEILERE
jgi:hypothetical protein